MSWGRDVEAKEARKKKSKQEEEDEEEEEEEEEGAGVTQDGVGLFLDWLAQVGRFVYIFCEKYLSTISTSTTSTTSTSSAPPP